MGNLLTAIDANINRAVEGIRVCEDLMRFVYRDDSKASKLKVVRHNIVSNASFFDKKELLNSRDVESDKNKFVDLKSELNRQNSEEIFISNIHRAIEAVRSLEEFTKIYDSKVSSKYQSIRFNLYSLEKEIAGKIYRDSYRKYFNKSLYAILDSEFIKDNSYVETAKSFIQGGVLILQLRMKKASSSEILSVAKQLSEICRDAGVLFIVNDHPEIAILSKAHGIHVGQDDISVTELRKILPIDMIIGISTHSLDQARKALVSNPDYIAIGPIFGTTSKTDSRIEAVDQDIIDIKKESSIPIVAIGGLTKNNVSSIYEKGIDSCAVISSLYEENNYANNCREFVDIGLKYLQIIS